MKRQLAISLVIASISIASLSGIARAEDEKPVDGATRAKITETLQGQGYEVVNVKSEDGMYEAYVKKDGKRIELYLNDKMEIVKTKED